MVIFVDWTIFLIFFINFGCFWPTKRPKKAKIKKQFFVEFSCIGKYLQTKFQKISSNSLDFANFIHFWSILAVFWLKSDQKSGQKRTISKKINL